MKDLGIRFSIYDFLGYFVPGMIWFVLIYFSVPLFQTDLKQLMSDAQKLFSETPSSMLLFGAFAIYLVGYTNGAIAYFLLEDLVLNRMLKRWFDRPFAHGDEQVFQQFRTLYLSRYGFPFDTRNRKHLVTFTCMHEPALYERIFFFITAAGQSRGFSLIALILFIYQFVLLVSGATAFNPEVLWISLVSFILFMAHYLRFKHRYEREAMLGFIDHNCANTKSRINPI